jgi:hypothetical protein
MSNGIWCWGGALEVEVETRQELGCIGAGIGIGIAWQQLLLLPPENVIELGQQSQEEEAGYHAQAAFYHPSPFHLSLSLSLSKLISDYQIKWHGEKQTNQVIKGLVPAREKRVSQIRSHGELS